MGESNSKASKTTAPNDIIVPAPNAQYVQAPSEIEQLSKIDFSTLENRSIMKGEYTGRVVDMYDGDTMKIAIYNESGKLELLQIRVMGADTPELKGSTSEAGRAAKNGALTYLGAEGAHGLTNGCKMLNFFQKNPIYVRAKFVPEREKFGRFLAYIYKYGETVSLSEYLISKGLAVPYNGGTKDQSMFENGSCKYTPEPLADIDVLEEIRSKINSEAFKNETPSEAKLIKEILEIVEENPSKYSKSVDAFERKKLVRKLRSQSITTANGFLDKLVA